MSSTWIAQHLQDDANAPNRTRGSAAKRAAEDVVMTPNWTTERPKKPGDYWFSLPVANRVPFASPDVVRCVVFASECALPSLYVSWMDADGCCRILSLQKDKLDGALWAPRETPADPFEE